MATTGRPKPPTTVDLYVWIYINKNNELVISKNKITAPTDALLKEKSINVRSNGLARDGSFDSKLVKSVKFAEKIRPISCRNWFYGFTNLVEVKNIENLYTDKCEDMYFMFYNCSSLKEINLKYFETSNVTDMRCMFSNCSSLKYLDLSSFDISKSKDCNYMMDTGTSTTIKANPDSIIETNYPAFIVPRGFKCRNNREINDTHTNLTTSIYYSKPSSITSPVESKRTELRALR